MYTRVGDQAILAGIRMQKHMRNFRRRKAQARKRAELRKARSARSSSLAAGRERQAPQASA